MAAINPQTAERIWFNETWTLADKDGFSTPMVRCAWPHCPINHAEWDMQTADDGLQYCDEHLKRFNETNQP